MTKNILIGGGNRLKLKHHIVFTSGGFTGMLAKLSKRLTILTVWPSKLVLIITDLPCILVAKASFSTQFPLFTQLKARSRNTTVQYFSRVYIVNEHKPLHVHVCLSIYISIYCKNLTLVLNSVSLQQQRMSEAFRSSMGLFMLTARSCDIHPLLLLNVRNPTNRKI